MTGRPAPTLLCGYCNAAHDPAHSCRCPASVQAREARRAEREARLDAQRFGVARLDAKGVATKGGWR